MRSRHHRDGLGFLWIWRASAIYAWDETIRNVGFARLHGGRDMGDGLILRVSMKKVMNSKDMG